MKNVVFPLVFLLFSPKCISSFSSSFHRLSPSRFFIWDTQAVKNRIRKGSVIGSEFCCASGSRFAPFWVRFGHPKSAPKPFQNRLPRLLAASGWPKLALRKPQESLDDHFGISWAPWHLSWADFGCSWGHLDPPGTPPWADFGCFWVLLDLSGE